MHCARYSMTLFCIHFFISKLLRAAAVIVSFSVFTAKLDIYKLNLAIDRERAMIEWKRELQTNDDTTRAGTGQGFLHDRCLCLIDGTCRVMTKATSRSAVSSPHCGPLRLACRENSLQSLFQSLVALSFVLHVIIIFDCEKLST